MLYSLRQISHSLQRVFSAKGKRRGKTTKLTQCGYCVRICVCKEYDYNIIPVFEEFTDQQGKKLSVSLRFQAHTTCHFILSSQGKISKSWLRVAFIWPRKRRVLFCVSRSDQDRRCPNHVRKINCPVFYYFGQMSFRFQTCKPGRIDLDSLRVFQDTLTNEAQAKTVYLISQDMYIDIDMLQVRSWEQLTLENCRRIKLVVRQATEAQPIQCSDLRNNFWRQKRIVVKSTGFEVSSLYSNPEPDIDQLSYLGQATSQFWLPHW